LLEVVPRPAGCSVWRLVGPRAPASLQGEECRSVTYSSRALPKRCSSARHPDAVCLAKNLPAVPQTPAPGALAVPKQYHHPSLSTPPPSWWPQHHGDGGSKTRGQLAGVEETKRSAGRGEEGTGPGPGAARPWGRPPGAMVKLGLAASGARLLPR